MRILWIVNTIFPYPSKKLGIKESVFGGWLNGLFNNLKKNKDIKLCVATVYDGNTLKKYDDGETIYYLIPYKDKNKYDKKAIKYFKEIDLDFKPNLTHIHGSEYGFGLVYQDNTNVKTLLSIQGLVSVYANYYLANLENKDIIRNITLRDILKRETLYGAKRQFIERGKYEIDLIKKVNFITGRTGWDYANTYKYCLNEKYFPCNETLRESFYNNSWSVDNIKRRTIFISQATYPIKGFHVMLKALYLLKQKYSDVVVYVAGSNILKQDTISQKIRLNGYAKYLINLIKKYNLEDNILFLGLLSEEEMCKKMLEANVFVQPSSIENSSNSLGEAMLLGMPIVASCVGGTNDLLLDKKEGLLFPSGEYSVLYKYISDIFDNDDLANSFGKFAHIHASKTHDRDKNANDMLNIYKEIINENI